MMDGHDKSHSIIEEVPLHIVGVLPHAVRVLPRHHDIQGAWFNEPYTTVKWMDGSTTTVKCHDGDEYDREKGLLLCFAKRLFGGGRYNDVMRRALGGEA